MYSATAHEEDAARLIEVLSTAVVLLDSRLRVKCLNPAAEDLLGLSKRQVTGMDWERAARGDAGLLGRLADALASGHPHVERELPMETCAGRRITVDCSVTPVGDTELLLELTQVDHHLRISREENLLEQNKATRQLVRGLAHEIKNPLGGLRGAAQLLERELGESEQKEYTQVIISEVDRLRNLVNRMLGPNQVPNIKPANIHEVLEHVRSLVDAESYPGLLIRREYDPSIPELWADAEMLVQALLNIVRNAAQSGCGNIMLRTSARRQFTIGNQLHKLVARVDIVDDGPGIPEELKDRVFYPMVTGREEGTGLGLSISQSLVNQHKGVIECQSQPGHTVFTIFLPLGVSNGS